MSFECLKSFDGRKRSLNQDWEKWLKSADKFYKKFLAQVGDSPFSFNEVSSVGFLSSAATIAGFIPIMEYSIAKLKLDSTESTHGRADLWFYGTERCYSLEFKRAKRMANVKNLSQRLSSAIADIGRVDESEYHYAVACVSAWVADENRHQTYREFAASDEVDAAYRIGPKGVGGTYLYFSLKADK